MRTTLLAGVVAAVPCLLLSGCTEEDSAGDNRLTSAETADAQPCQATVLNIREEQVMDRARFYDIRYRVKVPGKPAYEDTQNTELDMIQVANIVAVSKTYPCKVSRTDQGRVEVDWSRPVTASPSPSSSTKKPTSKPSPSRT